MKRTRPLTIEEALSKAAGLCSKCEQCTPELRRKIAAWGLNTDAVDKIIQKLESMQFVDDHRYARAYAHDKLVFSGWGRNKIFQGLRAKFIPKKFIDSSMDDIDDDEYSSVAERVIRAKLRQTANYPLSYEAKVKILRFALQRGFESRLAISIINKVAKEINESEPSTDD